MNLQTLIIKLFRIGLNNELLYIIIIFKVATSSSNIFFIIIATSSSNTFFIIVATSSSNTFLLHLQPLHQIHFNYSCNPFLKYIFNVVSASLPNKFFTTVATFHQLNIYFSCNIILTWFVVFVYQLPEQWRTHHTTG